MKVPNTHMTQREPLHTPNSNDLEIHILHVLQFLLCIFQRNTQQHTDAPSNGTYLLSSN